MPRNFARDKDAATHLHYIDGALWLDTDIGEEDGLCIGLGETLIEAATDALAELEARCADLRAAIADERREDEAAAACAAHDAHGAEQ
jgi:hypothetical protein